MEVPCMCLDHATAGDYGISDVNLTSGLDMYMFHCDQVTMLELLAICSPT